MERYVIRTMQFEKGWTAVCPALSVTVDAATRESAIRGCIRVCEETGREILQKGLPLPAEDFSDEENGGLIVRFSMTEDYKKQYAKPVRRTVSLPEWLDRQLRAADVDPSALFQEAAVAKLRELSFSPYGTRKIENVNDLEDACAPGVLDAYADERIRRFLRNAMILNEKGGN